MIRHRIRAVAFAAAALFGATGLATAPAHAVDPTQTYETSWYEDYKVSGVMSVTLHPNGDADWWSRVDNDGIARHDYHFQCAVVSPTGLVITSNKVDRSVKGKFFGSKRARDRHSQTDHDNPNVRREYAAIAAAGGVVTKRVGLQDDGVHYTYDCYLEDGGR